MKYCENKLKETFTNKKSLKSLKQYNIYFNIIYFCIIYLLLYFIINTNNLLI